MSLGLGANQDLLQYIGAIGPTARSLWYGNKLEIFYNNQIRDTVSKIPDFNIPDLWAGWTHFTNLLEEDAAKAGTPSPELTPIEYKLESVELSDAELENLMTGNKFLYYIYRGDVDWTNQSFTLASAYTPELGIFLSMIFPDFQWIFKKYAEWMNERLKGIPATTEAKIISKSILLANYRWYMLVGDLLANVDPIFQSNAFQDGLSKMAQWIRNEAETLKLK